MSRIISSDRNVSLLLIHIYHKSIFNQQSKCKPHCKMTITECMYQNLISITAFILLKFELQAVRNITRGKTPKTEF